MRPVDRYIAGLREIRMIQDYVLERAYRNDVPVIENESARDAVSAVMGSCWSMPSGPPDGLR